MMLERTINLLLMGVVGTVVIATGLAFGLAGRERARNFMNRWARADDSTHPATAPKPQVSYGVPSPGVSWVHRSAHDRRMMISVSANGTGKDRRKNRERREYAL